LLSHAAVHGSLPIVQVLVSQHRSVSALPLLAAASEGHIDIVQYLIEGGYSDINGVDADNANALIAASARGQEDVIKYLLQQSAVRLDSQNTDGHTALMFAYNGRSQVRSVYAKIKNVIKDSDEETEFILSEALRSYDSVIDMLLAAGANTKLQVTKKNAYALSRNLT
jgi:ankyrin repeat protein